jgi:hypothetical protein
MNTRDAFDRWFSTYPGAMHHLTITEIWQAAYDQARIDLREEASEWAEGEILRQAGEIEREREILRAEAEREARDAGV